MTDYKRKERGLYIDLDKVKTDDPEVLDFISSTTDAIERLKIVMETNQEAKDLAKVLVLEKSEDEILERIHNIEVEGEQEEKFHKFTKAVTDLYSLYALKKMRGHELLIAKTDSFHQEVGDSEWEELKEKIREYSQELEMFPDKIARLAGAIYEKYPDYVKQLGLEELLNKENLDEN